MANKQLTSWKAVAQETAVIEDDGDILLPLKRLHDQYVHRAEELDHKAYGDNRAKIQAAAQRYRNAADSVQRLIGVVSTTDFVEESAPVDQLELIASDIQERVLATLPADALGSNTELCGNLDLGL